MDEARLRRHLMRTPSPRVDKPYAIQHALPEASQPRYATEFVRPVLTHVQSPSTLLPLNRWQQAHANAQAFFRAAVAPLQPALALLQPSLIEDDPDGLEALRRAYAATLRNNPSSCAVDTDEETDDTEETDEEKAEDSPRVAETPQLRAPA